MVMFTGSLLLSEIFSKRTIVTEEGLLPDHKCVKNVYKSDGINESFFLQLKNNFADTFAKREVDSIALSSIRGSQDHPVKQWTNRARPVFKVEEEESGNDENNA